MLTGALERAVRIVVSCVVEIYTCYAKKLKTYIQLLISSLYCFVSVMFCT
jgi:hypothetical protein